MGKRIKQVFSSHDQVLHLWANQSQPHARSNNVFYNGKSCFSYGEHYELGRIVEYRGVKVALINNTGYSVTTGKHISSAYYACSDLMPVFYTKGSLGNVKAALLERQGTIINDLFSIFSRTSVSEYCKWSTEKNYGDQHTINEFNSWCKLLKHPELTLKVDADFIGLHNAHVELRMQRQAELTSPENIAKREAKVLKAKAAAILKWRQGGALTKELRNLHYQLIRVNGNEVQTTRGASVPLTHALRLLRMINKGTAKSGEKVGHFSLSGITKTPDAQVIRIGCHSILLSEASEVLNEVKPKLSLVSEA